MTFSVSAVEVVERLPETDKPLAENTIDRLIADATDSIEVAFWQAHRDFNTEVVASPMLAKSARLVIFEMVAAHVVAASRNGLKAVSSATGAISDRWEFAEGIQTGWASALLTDDLKRQLGLMSALPRGNFTQPYFWRN